MHGRALSVVATLPMFACAGVPPRASAPSVTAPEVELVESWPLETSLDHADIRDAKDVWRELVDSAQRRLDFAEFYSSDDPSRRSSLTAVVEAVERAVARGVKVRWLGDANFAKTYPELLDRLSRAGVEVRRFDVSRTLGGVLHAKYFLVDGQAYLGSQNFDWRSLDHIQELGARITVVEVVRALSDVFELDWSLAAGAALHPMPRLGPTGFPVVADHGQITFVASPKGWLPDERLWDLPALVALIDSARTSVHVQLLTYLAHPNHGQDFPELDTALRRAAARGVRVELLVSDWSKRPGIVDGLRVLQGVPSIQVKFLSIPLHSSGFIPFARVAHAKYLVVDGARAWVGTSNWERDYFYASRNVGVVIEGGALPARLDAFFAQNWSSSYAETFDPGRAYAPPRVGD